MAGQAMEADGGGVKRGIAIGVLLIAALAIGYHLRDLAIRLSGSVAGKGAPSDFELILCGGRHLEAPYADCAGSNPLSGFLYPPPSTAYTRLIDAAGTDIAFRLQTGVSLTLLILSLVLLVRMLPVAGRDGRDVRGAALASVAGAAAIAPVGNTLYGGHINIMLLAAFVAAAWAAARGRPILAGVAGALGFWLKLYPAALAALFVMRRMSRPAILWAALFMVAVPVLLLPWVPAGLYAEYFTKFLPHMQRFTAPGDALSIAAVILRWCEGGTVPGFHAVEIPPLLRLVSFAALAAGVAVAMAHDRAVGDRAPAEPLALLMATLLLASPLAWSHHFVLALPLVFVTLHGAVARPAASSILALGCWAALLIPGWTPLPAASALPAWAKAVYDARYPIAVLVMMASLVRARRAEWGAAWTHARA